VKKKISALVFDFGGVMARPQDPACVRQLMDIRGLGGAVERFKSVYFARRIEYARGAVDVHEYWEGVCRELGIALPAQSLPALIAKDLDAWFVYRPAMIEAVAALKSRVRTVALLSNINFEGIGRLRSTFPRPGLFDHMTFSCELGLMKPERAIFDYCLGAIGAEPGESLFVDDSAENVEGARAAGMNAHRFIDEIHFLAELETFYEVSR
jgi:putative hydrolase of the HAD superfamily